MIEQKIKAVATKAVLMTADEFKYYLSLKDKYGEKSFADLFITDNNGIILSVSPPTTGDTPMAVIFFLLNLMFTQRMNTMYLEIGSIKRLKSEMEGELKKMREANAALKTD